MRTPNALASTYPHLPTSARHEFKEVTGTLKIRTTRNPNKTKGRTISNRNRTRGIRSRREVTNCVAFLIARGRLEMGPKPLKTKDRRSF